MGMVSYDIIVRMLCVCCHPCYRVFIALKFVLPAGSVLSVCVSDGTQMIRELE